MYSSNFSSEYEQTSILLQTPVTVAINGSCEPHPVVCKSLKVTNVGGFIVIPANDDERPVGIDLAISLDDQLGIVLRFEPSHVKNVAPADEPKLTKVVTSDGRLRPVCNHFRFFPVPKPVIVLDRPCVGYKSGRGKRRKELAKMQKALSDKVPFASFSI